MNPHRSHRIAAQRFIASSMKSEREELNILLVEDNPSNQRLLSVGLERMGATVTLAENGSVAVQKALKDTFDVIVMDLDMPITDGREAIEAIRNCAGPNSESQILVSSGRDDQAAKDACREAGADAFITKPFDLSDLRFEIEQLTNPDLTSTSTG